MNSTRLIAHLLMWGLIAAGFFLAFVLIPPQIIFSKTNQRYLSFLLVPLSLYFLYHLMAAVYIRRTQLDFFREDIKKIIAAGEYGKMAHPSCISLGIILWILFLIFPDARILAGDLWMTLVLWGWIRMEKEFFGDGSQKENDLDDSTPG